MAKAAYRHLLRAARIAFQGDLRLLNAAREQARKGFESYRDLSPGSQEANKRVTHAEDVARMLRHNIVQGQAEEGTQNYKLRIHPDIERGNNEPIEPEALGKCYSA